MIKFSVEFGRYFTITNISFMENTRDNKPHLGPIEEKTQEQEAI